ncbi:MAG: hypothetical protein MUD01_15605 [Chloroflexaceae bacterium]|nr:hypothetical protein [Chloroflexaceae bacterium]
MYRRGIEDAEANDLNPFYYQHYYHYRRGYDETRRRVRTGVDKAPGWLLMVPVVLVLGVALVWFWSAWSSTRTPLTPPVAAVPSPMPTATLAPPTATPEPSPTPAPVLKAGGVARVVNVGEAQLRGRQQPGTGQPVQARFEEGTTVRVLEGPVDADGFTWWRIEGPRGNGWSAERSAEGVVWLEPVAE